MRRLASEPCHDDRNRARPHSSHRNILFPDFAVSAAKESARMKPNTHRMPAPNPTAPTAAPESFVSRRNELSAPLATYYAELRAVPKGATPELSYRTPLENFLNASAAVLGFAGVHFTNEAGANALGRPDFQATTSGGLVEVGYVEAEAVTADLANLKGSAKAQNDRFIAGLPNFLQTNHTDFRLYSKGDTTAVAKVKLPAFDTHTGAQIPDEGRDALAALLFRFLSDATATVSTSENLARLLAMRASLLRDNAEKLLNAGSDKLTPLLASYRAALVTDVSEKQFADLYAQTFAYGLFLAWMRHDNVKPFDQTIAVRLLPEAVAPIRALIRFGLTDLPPELDWIVSGIVGDLAKADRTAALGAKQTDGKEPMIHFYETFLAAYDKTLRKATGTYYTPEPVTDWIVRAVDDLLESPGFNLDGGLANPAVRLLDPATGTGTFLARAYRRVKERMSDIGDAALFPDRAKSHLAKHFFGFELLPAAYTLAHQIGRAHV